VECSRSVDDKLLQQQQPQQRAPNSNAAALLGLQCWPSGRHLATQQTLCWPATALRFLGEFTEAAAAVYAACNTHGVPHEKILVMLDQWRRQ
jgi:hypothetical protein